MEAHNEIRKNIPALWSRNQNVIVNRIRNQWKIMEFSEEEIHTICGYLEVNCFEVGQNGSNSARALFPEAYLLCHDCIPNTNHTDDATTHELIIRTTKPLKKDEVITLSYAYTLQVTHNYLILLLFVLRNCKLNSFILISGYFKAKKSFARS